MLIFCGSALYVRAISCLATAVVSFGFLIAAPFFDKGSFYSYKTETGQSEVVTYRARHVFTYSWFSLLAFCMTLTNVLGGIAMIYLCEGSPSVGLLFAGLWLELVPLLTISQK